MACAFVKNMVFPPSPTVENTAPLPPTSLPPSISPTVPPPTETVIYESACPNLLEAILKADTSNPTGTFEPEEQIWYFVTYTIADNKLGKRQDIFVPDELRDERDARASHELIWNYFTALVPEKERAYVAEFSVISDGRENVLAAVGPTHENPTQWALKVDILDSSDPHTLTNTLLHEFGHLLTLNSKQVTLDRLVFYNPDDKNFYERAISACDQYFTGMGCSSPNSYMNEFFNRFWTDLYTEWQDINLEEDENTHDKMLDDFYKIYRDQFLTDYAATSPAEDIAESWAYFVLSPKPELNSIANEKILFFYEYPELVALRQEILNRLCVEFPR